MRYRNFIAPMLGLAIASVATAQTTYPQPATPQPAIPQTTTPQTTSPMPSSPNEGMSPAQYPRQDTGAYARPEQRPFERGGEMAFVQAHLDTVLTGVALTYSQYRRIDSTAAAALFAARGQDRSYGAQNPGQRRDSLGRDSSQWNGTRRENMGRMGMRNDTLDAAGRQRLLPILGQIDTSVRSVLTTAQQRTFDRNVDAWKHRTATATY